MWDGCARPTKTVSATTSGSAFSWCATEWAATQPVKSPARSPWIPCSDTFGSVKPAVEEDAYLDDAPLGARLLAEAVKQANDAILEYADAHKNTSGMGTTLVAARFAEGTVSIANVGDSRIYLFREGQLLQLTEDHSLVMEQVRRGMLTLEEAKRSSAQNIITRALGTDETTLPDLGEFPAQAGDVLLLATDGVLRHVEDDRDSRHPAANPFAESRLRDPDRCRQRRRRRRQLNLRAGTRAQRGSSKADPETPPPA